MKIQNSKFKIQKSKVKSQKMGQAKGGGLELESQR